MNHLTTHGDRSPANVLKRRYFLLEPAGLSKHIRLRQSIIGAIDDGELEYQAKLPPEKVLGDLLGISLGTTQKALNTLAGEGYLLREQGNGTFVGRSRRPLQGLWHFRFTDPKTKLHMPVTARLTHRELVGDGSWTDVLGHDVEGYVRIDRVINVGSRFNCLSQLYLPASTCAPVLDFPVERLENVNLKVILESEFGLPTVESSGGVRAVQLEPAQIKKMGVKVVPAWGLAVKVVAKTKGNRAISVQLVTIPSTDYDLDIDFTGSY
jgi:GntR family transcriptional regulator